MKQLSYLLLLAISLLLISCGGEEEPMVQPPSDDEPLIVLDKAPFFELNTFDGGIINNKDFEGDVYVLFIFGNACGPCIAVGPEIESRLNVAFSERDDYRIIGIDNWDGNIAAVEAYAERSGVTFPLGVMGSEVSRQFDSTYDRLLVVGRDGGVAYRGNSVAANNLDEAVKVVTGLLAE
jgi:peroxiredoxin